MKKIITLFITLISICIYSQEPVDIVTPKQATFNSGQDIEGLVQSSVNEPTGKVTFSIPIASLAARLVSHSVSISYNGQSAFDIGSQTNKFVSTSPLGVGFDLFTPKIVANNKNTATKQDDTFYLQDGANNTRLYCINRIEPGSSSTTPNTGKVIWEFQAEQYVPWKIKYYKSEIFELHGALVERPLDYWIITNDRGMDYVYGKTLNARERAVAWGNWIGNSNKSGGKTETIVWNLSTIQDQWNNNISFEYEHQEVSMGVIKQTEATYIKKISSSTGENIRFSYATKGVNEYYEPHKEQVEPDAYQERYQKKYLQSISTYDDDSNLVFDYKLAYNLVNNSSSTDKKRYLSTITQEDASGNFLPSQQFQYYTSGAFKGGLKKVTYPMGGSATYTYKNKLLFNNTANNFESVVSNNPDYNFHAIATKDNYTLRLLKSKKPISDGKYQFRVIRNWWNGQNWEDKAYTLPYLIKDEFPNGTIHLENFHTVFGPDYYGFLYLDGNGANTRLDLFHLKSNNSGWVRESFDNTDISSFYNPSSLSTYEESDTAFLSGDKFVAVADGNSNTLYTFTWNGNTWTKNSIYQTNPNTNSSSYYHYGATNNYIITLDRKGIGTPNLTRKDFITGNYSKDYFYIHYLDIENKWVSKSWSADMNPSFNKIEKDSYFYPNSALTGFVSDHNPEVFLRWDKNYNLLAIDNTVLGSHNDSSPIVPTYSGMFILQNNFSQRPIKFSRFNGVDWKATDYASNSGSSPSYGQDMMTYQHTNNVNRYIGYAFYDPNINQWEINNTFDVRTINNGQKISGITRDFLIAQNNIYSFSNATSSLTLSETIPGNNIFTHTDGLNHAFVETENPLTNGSRAGLFFYMDKTTNEIKNINMGNQYKHFFSGPSKFAGRTPFMSPKSLWLRSNDSNFLYRIIDDKINNDIKDIVVQNVKVNNGKGEIRETSYYYNTPNSTPNNNITYYRDVTIENKGYGNASNGKIEKLYDNGSNDLQMAGLLMGTKIKKSDNSTVSNQINSWNKFIKDSKSYTIKLLKQTNWTYLEGGIVSNTIDNTYTTDHFLPKTTKRTNSKGQVEETEIQYAANKFEYLFMKEANFLTQPYEIITKVGTRTTSIDRTVWAKNGDNKIYNSETQSGTNLSSMRTLSKNTKISDYGQVLESTDGQIIYSTVLYGYDNKYPVVSIANAKYEDVISKLDVSIASLQSLNNTELKSELSKLYTRLPEAMIDIDLFDSQGKVIKNINEREYEINFYYDGFNRLEYSSDINNKILEKNIYNYRTN